MSKPPSPFPILERSVSIEDLVVDFVPLPNPLNLSERLLVRLSVKDSTTFVSVKPIVCAMPAKFFAVLYANCAFLYLAARAGFTKVKPSGTTKSLTTLNFDLVGAKPNNVPVFGS